MMLKMLPEVRKYGEATDSAIHSRTVQPATQVSTGR